MSLEDNHRAFCPEQLEIGIWRDLMLDQDTCIFLHILHGVC